MVVREYLEGFLSEILFRTKKDKKTFGIWYLGYGLAVAIISMIGLKIIGIHGVVLKGLLVGLFSLVPFMGSGIIMIPWILARVISNEKMLGSQLAILFIILCILKEIAYPFLIKIKFNIRPIILSVLFLIFFTIGKETGAIWASVIIFIITTLFDAVDIQSYYRKNRSRIRRMARY